MARTRPIRGGRCWLPLQLEDAPLARHSDINLTMNTHTMLSALDQVATVEALPPLPKAKPEVEVRAVGA